MGQDGQLYSSRQSDILGEADRQFTFAGNILSDKRLGRAIRAVENKTNSGKGVINDGLAIRVGDAGE